MRENDPGVVVLHGRPARLVALVVHHQGLVEEESVNCACGLSLHYSDPEIERYMTWLTETKGEFQKITIPPYGSWMVQRHYIALHGISGPELVLMPDRWKRLIEHDADWECNECGGPSPETSMQGCQFCGGQGDIVPRGTAMIRTWRPAR